MPDIDDINAAIALNAADGVKSASVDGNSVTQHSIAEQIAAANHVAATTAATIPHFGLRMTKLVPPGCG